MLGHGRDPLLIDPGHSTGSLSLDTVGKRMMPPWPHQDLTAGGRQSLSAGSLPIGCLGLTLNALD